MLPLNGGTRVALFFNEGGGAFTLKLFGELRASEHDVSPFAVGVLAGKDSEPVLAIGRNLETAEKSLDFQKCGFDSLGINVECSIVVPSQASTFYTIHRAQRSLEPIAPSALTGEGNALGYGILDIDGDERQDLIAAMDFLPQRAFRRSGPSSFEEPAQDLGLNVFAHGMGVALGDWDDDGHTDAVITTLGGVLDFAGTPSGGFAFRGSASPFMTRKRSIWPWTALFADLDTTWDRIARELDRLAAVTLTGLLLVVLLSLGHPIYESAARDPLVQAVESAVRAGITVVVTAGNIGITIFSPGTDYVTTSADNGGYEEYEPTTLDAEPHRLAHRQLPCGDGAPRAGDPPGPEPREDPQHRSMPIDEHHVDRVTHAEGVDRGAGPQA